ncbi:MAG: alpha/beta hydrolase [Dehalococcoidia bacterium]
MPFLKLPDCDLYYETTGAGPALVFAHGLAGNHISWWQQVPHFRDRYTCVSFAHRGFMPSREAPDGPGATAFADDLEALIDHLGLDDVRLVAQSMGGWTCLEYTLRHPDKVRALVMASTIGTMAHPDVNRMYAERGASPEPALFERGIHPAAGERMAREQPVMHYLYQQISDLSPDLDRDKLRRQLVELRTTPAEALAELRAPVLCISGTEDIVILPPAVELLASLLPNARLERVPEAGHSVYFERAETFNQLVDGFLSAL